MSALPFDAFLSTPEALEALGAEAVVAAMLRFEAALARAQAACGLMPVAVAQSISDVCARIDRFDVPQIVRDSSCAGSLAIPLVAALRDAVAQHDAPAAAAVHRGSTSQDVIDTAVSLASRDVLRGIDADVGRCIEALLALAEQHAATPMLARTLGQPASVTTFGWKAAQWAAGLVRGRARVRAAAASALAVQLGGAAGTQAGQGGQGARLVALIAAELGLAAPDAPWHTQRDDWVALGCAVALLVGSIGKVALDVSLLAQWEVAEVAEPEAPGRGGSSAMPHKRNPVGAMVALAAAQRTPQRAAALLGAMVQAHERALGPWQAELAEWPQLLLSAAGAARAMAEALGGLQVDAQRMAANLQALRASLPDDAAAEWFAAEHLVPPVAELARAQVARLRAALSAADQRLP